MATNLAVIQSGKVRVTKLFESYLIFLFTRMKNLILLLGLLLVTGPFVSALWWGEYSKWNQPFLSYLFKGDADSDGDGLTDAEDDDDDNDGIADEGKLCDA